MSSCNFVGHDQHMAKVIAVLNQKGGTGKTTLATNIATALHMQKNKVLLVDGDPQGSARDWAAARQENVTKSATFTLIALDRAAMFANLKSISEQFDYVVIDGSPQIAELAAAAIKCSDLILIPVQPSPYDVWATNSLVELIKTRMHIADLKAAFVISRAIKNTKISTSVSRVLTEFELPVLKAKTHQRVIYVSSVGEGKSVLEYPENSGAVEASNEIKAIVKECLSLIQ